MYQPSFMSFSSIILLYHLPINSSVFFSRAPVFSGYFLYWLPLMLFRNVTWKSRPVFMLLENKINQIIRNKNKEINLWMNIPFVNRNCGADLLDCLAFFKPFTHLMLSFMPAFHCGLYLLLKINFLFLWSVIEVQLILWINWRL